MFNNLFNFSSLVNFLTVWSVQMTEMLNMVGGIDRLVELIQTGETVEAFPGIFMKGCNMDKMYPGMMVHGQCIPIGSISWVFADQSACEATDPRAKEIIVHELVHAVVGYPAIAKISGQSTMKTGDMDIKLQWMNEVIAFAMSLMIVAPRGWDAKTAIRTAIHTINITPAYAPLRGREEWGKELMDSQEELEVEYTPQIEQEENSEWDSLTVDMEKTKIVGPDIDNAIKIYEKNQI